MNDSLQQPVETVYAQQVSSIVSQYDATLIFYQLRPMPVNKGDTLNFRAEPQEVARIILPNKALFELSQVLHKQISGISGEDETLNKLKKKK